MTSEKRLRCAGVAALICRAKGTKAFRGKCETVLDSKLGIMGRGGEFMKERSRYGYFESILSPNPKSKTCSEAFGCGRDKLRRTVQMRPRGRQWILVVAIVSALTVCGARVQAQQLGKVPRIAFLSNNRIAAVSSWNEAFRQGLREFGYVEGKTIVLEWRFAEGKPDRLPTLAAELVRLKVDVIVSGGSTATGPAKEATSTIPIMKSQDNDPVGNGFVASLARPGGNITGLATLRSELSGKRLELLKEIVPKLSRVAILGSSTNPGNAELLKETELAAGAFGVKLQYLDVRGAIDLETAFREAGTGRADAILVLAGPVFSIRRTEVIQLAIKSRLPAIYDRRDFSEAGGLMTYGVSVADLDRRAATYVDKILKGAKPADLPVEQPTKFEFIINLKTAKQIGLTIPPNVLARADRVIR
jgi:putative tryptophan/tyrosine transport system substrate-binding protein